MIQITDDLLYKCVPKAEKLMLEQIPSEDQLTHVFSNNFERKMKILLRKTKHKPFKNVFTKAKRVVIMFLIIIAVFFTTIMSVEAFRIRFFEMITKIYYDLTAITFIIDEKPSEIQFQIMKPQYIPEGYEITREEKTFTTAYTIYTNQTDIQIIFEQSYVTNDMVIIDTENIEMEELQINGDEVQYFYNKQTHQFMWTQGEYYFSLISDIHDKSELIRMIESLK